MDWHQPWLLALSEHELMHLHDDCRTRAKSNMHAQRFGLARAWDGLAHEVLERARELASGDDPPQAQLTLAECATPRGAYAKTEEDRIAGDALYEEWLARRGRGVVALPDES